MVLHSVAPYLFFGGHASVLSAPPLLHVSPKKPCAMGALMQACSRARLHVFIDTHSGARPCPLLLSHRI